MYLVLRLFLVMNGLSINGGFGNQLFIKEDWVDDVENVLPNLEVGHHCNLFDLYFENFFVRIEY